MEGSLWQDGPGFLCEEKNLWPIIHTYKKKLEGEVPVLKKLLTVLVSPTDRVKELVSRCSTWNKLIRVVARILRWFCKEKSGCPILRTDEIRNAKKKLIRFAQRTWLSNSKKLLRVKVDSESLCWTRTVFSGLVPD